MTEGNETPTLALWFIPVSSLRFLILTAGLKSCPIGWQMLAGLF
jgi:hypothetical protein